MVTKLEVLLREVLHSRPGYRAFIPHFIEWLVVLYFIINLHHVIYYFVLRTLQLKSQLLPLERRHSPRHQTRKPASQQRLHSQNLRLRIRPQCTSKEHDANWLRSNAVVPGTGTAVGGALLKACWYLSNRLHLGRASGRLAPVPWGVWDRPALRDLESARPAD